MTENEKTSPLTLVKESENTQSDEEKQVVELLGQAERQLSSGKLIAPKGNNALETYRKIISIDSENQEAFEGIHNLKQQLMSASTKEEDSAEKPSTEEPSEEPYSSEEDSLPEWKLPDYDSIVNSDAKTRIESESNVEIETTTSSIPPDSHPSITPKKHAAPPRKTKWPAIAGIVTVTGAIAALLIHQNPGIITNLKAKPQIAINQDGDNSQTEPDQRNVQPSTADTTGTDTMDTVENDEKPSEVQTVADIVNYDIADDNSISSPETDESLKEIEIMLAMSRDYLQADQLISPENENALSVLNLVLEQYPEHTEALLGMEMLKRKLLDKAAIAQNSNDWKTARDQLDALIQIEPENQQAMQGIAAIEKKVLELAASAKENQEWDTSKTYLLQVLAIDANNTEAQKLLEEVTIERARQNELSDLLEQAQNHLSEGRLIEPIGNNASFFFLQVLQRKPDNDTAIQGLNTITDELLAKAGDAQEKENWSDAATYLTAAQRFQPENAEIQNAVAIMNEKQEQARNTTSESIQVEKTQGQVETLLDEGKTYLETGQFYSPENKSALSVFDKVLAIDPNNQQAIQGIATVEKRILELSTEAIKDKKWSHAKNLLQKLLVINPSNAKAQEMLAEVSIGETKQNELSDLLSRAQRHLTDERLIQPAGDNAAFLLLQILQIDPENVAAKQGIETVTSRLIAKSQASQNEKNWDNARYYLQAAQRIQPENDDIHQAISTLTETQKRNDDVASLVTQAQKILEISPAGGDADRIALEQFNSVLALDAKNEEALQGMENIKNRFLTAAKQAGQNKQWEAALSSLNVVLSIDSQNQEAKELNQTLNQSLQESQEIVTWLENASQQLESDDLTYEQYEDVYALVSKVLEREPNNSLAVLNRKVLAERLWSAAHAAHTAENWDGAQPYYEFLLRMNSEDSRVQSSLTNLINEKKQHIELENLLALGNKYIQENRLTEPTGDNAFSVFRQVLDIDPTNPQAKKGIESIQTQLLGLAQDAQKQEQWDTASAYLNTLLTLNPQLSEARSALEKLADIRAKETQTVAGNAEVADEISSTLEPLKPVSEQELLEILIGE